MKEKDWMKKNGRREALCIAGYWKKDPANEEF